MRKLLWKELYEQRLIPLACSALLASIILACFGFTLWESQHDKNPADLLTIGPTIAMLAVAIAILGLFPGSSAIAPEVGQGTLGFLGLLPGTRTRLWSSKVIAGLTTIFMSLAAVLIIYFVTLLCLYGHAKVGLAYKDFHGWTAAYDVPLNLLILAEIVMFGYAVSLFFSTIVDRTVTASVLAFVTVLGLGFGVLGIVSEVASNASGQWDGEYVIAWIAAFLDIAFLSSACVAFCTGNALKSSKHVRIALGTLLAWFVIGGLSLAAYAHLSSNRYYAALSDNEANGTPNFMWTAPKGYADNFLIAKQKNWTIAPTSPVPDTEAATKAIAKIPSDNADKDTKLIQDCQLSYAERYVVVGDPPVYLKNKIENVLKQKPNFFYAQYSLALWYARNHQLDAYRTWRDRALENAPAILAGRFQYDDGRPVVHGDFDVDVTISRWDAVKGTVQYRFLKFTNVTADENGCYYLPVYRGVYNIWMPGFNSNMLYGEIDDWKPASGGVMSTLTKTMAVESTPTNYFKSTTRIGLLPPIVARSYVSLTGTLGNTATSEKNPAILTSNSLDISWQPYPKADFYRVSLVEYKNEHGDYASYSPDTMPSQRIYEGFATKYSDSPGLHLDLAGRNPPLNPTSIYALHVTAFQGTRGDFWEEAKEQYADSHTFYFIPKAGRGPIPVPKNLFLMD